MNTAPQTIAARRQDLRPSVSRPSVQYDRRERDFGVGYGNSSGYAGARRYTRDWSSARFRFA